MLKTVVMLHIFVETYDNTIQKFGASKIVFQRKNNYFYSEKMH